MNTVITRESPEYIIAKFKSITTNTKLINLFIDKVNSESKTNKFESPIFQTYLNKFISMIDSDGEHLEYAIKQIHYNLLDLGGILEQDKKQGYDFFTESEKYLYLINLYIINSFGYIKVDNLLNLDLNGSLESKGYLFIQENGKFINLLPYEDLIESESGQPPLFLVKVKKIILQ